MGAFGFWGGVFVLDKPLPPIKRRRGDLLGNCDAEDVDFCPQKRMHPDRFLVLTQKREKMSK